MRTCVIEILHNMLWHLFILLCSHIGRCSTKLIRFLSRKLTGLHVNHTVSLLGQLLLLSFTFMSHTFSATEQHHCQPSEAAADHHPVWSATSSWWCRALFIICDMDTWRLLQGATFCSRMHSGLVSLEAVYWWPVMMWLCWLLDCGVIH